MPSSRVFDEDALNAGDFSDWMTSIEKALHGTAASNVPCGECTACCTSSQFIHIEPHETATLKRIPKKLLFAAPGLPKGNMVMGYDERGHCPMFKNGECSIYEHRPRTCREYDCRVFPAAGMTPEKVAIGEQVARWEFAYTDERAKQQHIAIQRAATYLRQNPEIISDERSLSNPAELAVLAIAVHDHFIADNETGTSTRNATDDPKSSATPYKNALRQAIAKFTASNRTSPR